MTNLPQIEGVTHRYVQARGLKFHVAEAGSGEDVVLCLHGWPQHWYAWRHLMPALADRHRVLALDLRGFGWSDAPRRGYEKENMASDVLAVLDELGIERVKLVGHDWGGWIGFLLCLRAPQRFDRFLALGITPIWINVGAALRNIWRFVYQQLILAPGIGYALHRSRRFIPRVLVGASTNRDPWDAATVSSFTDNLAEPARARAAVQMYRVFNLRETWPLLRGRYAKARLTVPTLLINGADDPVIRKALFAGYESHVDDMQVEIIDDCGHFIAEEKPELLAAKARAFLASDQKPAENPAR
jgi:pimeloyl-ACP methyl ester carboxylesterase